MDSGFEVKNILISSLTKNNTYLFKESLTIIPGETMPFVLVCEIIERQQAFSRRG